MNTRFVTSLILSIITVFYSEQVHGAVFQQIGPFPTLPGEVWSWRVMSGDGGTLVGDTLTDDGLKNVSKWTWDNELERLDGAFQARGISFDGSVVVGTALEGEGNANGRGFYHSEGSGLTLIRPFPGGFSARASDVTADGEVVVGVHSESTGFRPFLWTQVGGKQEFSNPPEVAQIIPTSVSADGSVIAGQTVIGGFLRDVPHRWTEDLGWESLGTLEAETHNLSKDVSADGTAIVGESWQGPVDPIHAFRWTAEDGMISLGNLGSVPESSGANAVSGDGSIVVGNSWTADWATLNAFIWDIDHGMRDLREFLVHEHDLGEQLEGWHLRQAMAISDDGLVIAGSGSLDGEDANWIVDLGSDLRPHFTLNGGGQTYFQNFDAMGTSRGRLAKGWNASMDDNNTRQIESLGLVDGVLEFLSDGSSFTLNLGGSSEHFEGSPGHVATWRRDLVRDTVLDAADIVEDGAEDRALGIGRVNENDPGSLEFEIEIGDAPLRAFTLDWDLEIWGGDPDTKFRGTDGGGFVTEVTVGGETYYEATVNHKPGELFHTQFDGADTDYNTTLIDGNLHSKRGNKSDIVEVDPEHGAVGNTINITFDADYGEHDKGWISAIDNFQLRALAPGDADGNGIVAVQDLVLLLQGNQFNSGPNDVTWAQGDFNGDDQFNIFDLVATLSFLGDSSLPSRLRVRTRRLGRRRTRRDRELCNRRSHRRLSRQHRQRHHHRIGRRDL